MSDTLSNEQLDRLKEQLKPLGDVPLVFDEENYGGGSNYGFGLLTDDGGITGIKIENRGSFDVAIAIARAVVALRNSADALIAQARRANELEVEAAKLRDAGEMRHRRLELILSVCRETWRPESMRLSQIEHEAEHCIFTGAPALAPSAPVTEAAS